MDAFKTTLDETEIVFFYQLLCEYEHLSHAGYQNDKVEEAIEGKIEIIEMDKGTIIPDSDKKLNVLIFTRYQDNKSWAILWHIRNSFAHANLHSVDGGKAFLIKDFSDKNNRTKCNMLGYIEKEKLYELINVIRETKKSKL